MAITINEQEPEYVDVREGPNSSAETELTATPLQNGPRYPAYLPTWATANEKWAPLEAFDAVDPGSRANPTLPNLFPKAGTDCKVSKLTPSASSRLFSAA